MQDRQGLVVAPAEIRHQDFDARGWRQRTDAPYAVDIMLRTAIAQVVAIDAGDDHILEFECGDGLGKVLRFLHVQWIRAAMTDVTKRATARALVAHDHEGCRAVAETLADVGATGLFAHGHQLVLAQNVFDLVEARCR